MSETGNPWVATSKKLHISDVCFRVDEGVKLGGGFLGGG
jgi:hypothetical protein